MTEANANEDILVLEPEAIKFNRSEVEVEIEEIVKGLEKADYLVDWNNTDRRLDNSRRLSNSAPFSSGVWTLYKGFVYQKENKDEIIVAINTKDKTKTKVLYKPEATEVLEVIEPFNNNLMYQVIEKQLRNVFILEDIIDLIMKVKPVEVEQMIISRNRTSSIILYEILNHMKLGML